MTQILIISNPFQPFKDLRRESAEPGQTVRQWLAGYYGPDFVEFPQPTVCQYNGEMIVRDEWDKRQFADGDIVAFVTCPGGVVAIIIAVIALAVAVAAYLLMPDPKIPADNTPSPDSVYTLRGQTNRFRPNEPIEVIYGKVRHWPTFASRPYSEYIGNHQYQYSLFCLGQGDFDIATLQLDDTPIGDFTEVVAEVVPPGGVVTLVESSVVTALEVSNIELLGVGADDYLGHSGPFTVNAFEAPIHRLAVDISFPSGLYDMSDEGDLEYLSVALMFQYRQIDEAGAAIGGWQVLANPTVTRADNTPQRLTFSCSVPAGRYEVMGWRVTPNYTSTKKSHQCRWETCKGYAQHISSFGDVTMIALRSLATNSLNDQTAKAFNVIATRKLPTWSPGGGWTGRVATRNPIWAFCDAFRSNYGAKLESSFLDLPTLYAMAQTFEAREDWFDWTFDAPLTVWEVATTILRVGRAVPVPQGSLITAVRDEPQELPAAIFNQHNIVKGSLSKTLSMFEFQPFDGLVIEYTDPATWKTKEVSCIVPGRAGLNLDRLKLPGCTDRARAYREGLYIQARREAQRKTVIFQTGLEGHIPAYLDLVAITHDTVRVGQGGMILAYDSATKEMTLSEQVTFATDNIVHKMALRGDDGAIMGDPITCYPGGLPNKVILDVDPPEDLDFSENRVPPLYAFGVADVWSFLGKVTGIRPMDGNTVELTVLNYAPGSYTLDGSTPDTETTVQIIRNASNPRVEWVTIAFVPNTADRVFVDWKPAPGAASYILQTSYDDGLTWNTAGTWNAPPVQLQVNQGTLRVRVAPYTLNGNVIYTASNPFVVGSNISVPAAPEFADVQTPFAVGEDMSVKWLSVTGAQGYNLAVYQHGGALLRNISAGSALRAAYLFADYEADGGNVGQIVDFVVSAYNSGGSGPTATLTLEPSGDPPPDPSGGTLIVELTLAEYAALTPKDPAVYYDITDAPWAY